MLGRSFYWCENGCGKKIHIKYYNERKNNKKYKCDVCKQEFTREELISENPSIKTQMNKYVSKKSTKKKHLYTNHNNNINNNIKRSKP